MKALYKKLAAYGLGSALALSGMFLVQPFEGENKGVKSASAAGRALKWLKYNHSRQCVGIHIST